MKRIFDIFAYLDIVSRPDQDAVKKIMVSFDGPGTSPENPAYSN